MTAFTTVDLLKRLLRRIEEALDARFKPVNERLDRILQRLDDVAADVDEVDRFNRPYGDGTKPPRNRRRS